MHWAHMCRAEILRVHLRRCPAAPDVDVCALAARSAGYSGADLAAVVREAGLAALEEDLGAEQVRSGCGAGCRQNRPDTVAGIQVKQTG